MNHGKETLNASSTRFEVIDGIRGWAAFIVLLFHLFSETFGTIYPAFKQGVCEMIFNAPLAVTIFFILSGDALSASFFSSRQRSVIGRQIVKRYFRLAIPIFFSCFTVYLLMEMNLNYSAKAAYIVNREDWLGRMLPFKADPLRMLYYSYVWVFTKHSIANSYNPFLWTMSIELVGSLVVFLYLQMYEQLRHPIVVLCAMIGMFYVFDLHYASFMCGVLLCYLRSIGHFFRSKRFVANPVGAAVIVMGILVLGGLSNRISGGHLWFNTIMGAIVLYVIYCNNFLQSIFVSRISRALGAISFPVYLCQFAVIISVTSYLIVWSYANHTLTIL